MIKSPRVIVLVLDGLGIGELPDAADYGDKNSNTIANVAKKVNGLELPNLKVMGLGNIANILGVAPEKNPIAAYGKAKEISKGKDSTTGHWELMGLQTSTSFPTYPNGFPQELITKLIENTEINGVIGNKAASGTVIINELGEKHLKTHYPIIYTSADSVFQIAAHEDIISVNQLYKICEIARNKILIGEHAVGRVIARPFIGNKKGKFERTPRRKDFSLDPPKTTLLDILFDKGILVSGIGKIEDLFNRRGLNSSIHTQHNPQALAAIEKHIKENNSGMIFANLPDFDTTWGHRNDYKNFASGLEKFDEKLSNIFKLMHKNDILFITADHGCDPTIPGTDHTREYIPILVYGTLIKTGVNIGTRDSFSDIAATIADIFDLKVDIFGKSFYQDIIQII